MKFEPLAWAGRALGTMIVKAGGLPAPFDRIVGQDMAAEKNPLHRPMAQSVWVMRAIKRIADPICAVPLEFSTLKADGTPTPFKDPTLETFWKRPAKDLSLHQFVHACVGWLKLKGEIFLILDDSWLAGGLVKSPVIMAKPDAMKEVVDQETDELVGWEWVQRNGERSLLIPDQVIQVKEWNPYNKWRGLAEMEAAKIAAETDYLQGRFAGNLARNNGDQGVFVVAKGNQPTEIQQRQIVEQLRMKRASAQRGELRPVFLAGDITIEDPKIQTPDADFSAQRLGNRHEIFNAFGVPPSMADPVAQYSVGAASDRYILIEDTCIPVSGRFCDAIAQISCRLLKRAPDSLTAKFNFDSHSVMLQVRMERLAASDKLWNKGVPMKVCNDYLRLGLPEYDGWDKGYLPFNVVPVDDAGATATIANAKPIGGKPTTEDAEFEENPTKTLRDLFAQRRIAIASGPVVKTSADADARLWKKHMAQRMPSVRKYQSGIVKCLNGARAEVIAKLASHYTMQGKSIVTKAGAAAHFMFDLTDFTSEFTSVMDQAARSAFDEAGQQVYDELGQDDPWVSPPAQVKAFLATRANKLKDVPDEIYNTINRTLTEGIDAGDSIKDLGKRVTAAFDEIGAGRARTIAMTETGAAYGTARQASMSAAGVQYKKWLTSGNSNVRQAHAEAEGQVRAIEEPYDVDGEEIDYPGDPDGSPDNVINCHCVSIPTADKDDDDEEDES